MIVKEHRERQQDIKGFEKLADIITEVEQTDLNDAGLDLFDLELMDDERAEVIEDAGFDPDDFEF